MYGEQSTPSSRFKSLLKGVNDFVGDQKIGFSQTVYLSEKATANRNFALAYYMASQGALQKHVDIQDTMDFYFQRMLLSSPQLRLAMSMIIDALFPLQFALSK
jgi:glutaminase